MSEPRDLSLERLGDRDGARSHHFGEIAHVGAPLAGSSSRTSQATYEALIDAVFLAPGAHEWLAGLRRAVAALLATKDSAPPVQAASEVPPPAGLRLWRP